MSHLQQTSPRGRLRLAAMLAPMAAVLLVAGSLPLTMGTGVAVTVLAALVLVVGLLLALVAAGLARSARLDLQEAALDSAIMAASPGCGSDCEGCAGAEDCAVKALPRR